MVSGDTVFVRSDIKKSDVNEFGEPVDAPLYTYREIQYTKDEFILLLSEKNASLEEQLTDTQLALCEIYESLAHPKTSANNIL